MKTIYNKKTLGIFFAAIILTLCALFAFHISPADAKGIFGVGKKTATATSTLAYMTPGTGTTTLSYDTYTDGLSTADSMALLVRLTASSTNTTLKINQEFSQDGIDWYQSTQPMIIQNSTTTVNPIALSGVPQYVWQFASSTINGVSITPASDTRIIPVKSPTRFTRFVFTVASSTLTPGNGAIWAQILPVKQNP